MRKAVVERIGPNTSTLSPLVERTLDVDENVRAAAFTRCSQINPERLKISNRQRILRCGFTEKNPSVKRIFIDQLLPSWLRFFNGDIIQFFKKLNLDADEEDLEQTFTLYKNLMDVLCKKNTFDEMTSHLKLNGEKLVIVEELTFEMVSYWNLLVGYLRKMDNDDEYLEHIVPDLVDMCEYLVR